MENNIPNDFNNSFDRNINEVPTRDSWKLMFDNLYNDLGSLYEKQFLLIRSEMKDKVGEVKTAAGTMGVGSAMLFVGVFAAAATAIIALDLFMPLWASAFIVTAILLVVGGVLFVDGKKKLSTDKLIPRHSLDTMGEIKSTFKERINEFKSSRHH